VQQHLHVLWLQTVAAACLPAARSPAAADASVAEVQSTSSCLAFLAERPTRTSIQPSAVCDVFIDDLKESVLVRSPALARVSHLLDTLL
jgi:hypothetical protein